MAEFLDEIRIRTKEILLQLLEAADLKAGNLLVVGCSSS